MAEVLNVIHDDLGTLVFRRGRPFHSSNPSPKDADDIASKPLDSGPDMQSAAAGNEFGPTGSRGRSTGALDSTLDIARVFLDKEQIGKGRIGRVYRGRIQPSEFSNNAHPPPGTVVVKLVFPQGRAKGIKLYPKGHDGQDMLADLAKEASIYSLMHEIQGEVIPRCFGYYHNEVAGCLVLEDCGNDLKFPYRRLPLQERRTLFELQKKMHLSGVSQGDVARRNFVRGPQGIRLLDFDRAVPHQCQGFEEPTFEGLFAKEAENVCPELRKLFRAFGLFPMEYYSLREQEAYKPWDGDPW